MVADFNQGLPSCSRLVALAMGAVMRGPGHQPGQRDLRRRGAVRRGHLVQRGQNAHAALIEVLFHHAAARALWPGPSSERYLPVRKPLASEK